MLGNQRFVGSVWRIKSRKSECIILLLLHSCITFEIHKFVRGDDRGVLLVDCNRISKRCYKCTKRLSDDAGVNKSK